MSKYIIGLFFILCGGVSLLMTSPVFAQTDDQKKYAECMKKCENAGRGQCNCRCKGGVVLNTNIPFIGRCIEKNADADTSDGDTTLGNAFPKLMGGLIRIVMSAVVIVGFIAVLVGGFMVAAEGAAGTKQKGMELIKLAIGGLVLVGLSGIILNLINPNFFKIASMIMAI